MNSRPNDNSYNMSDELIEHPRKKKIAINCRSEGGEKVKSGNTHYI